MKHLGNLESTQEARVARGVAEQPWAFKKMLLKNIKHNDYKNTLFNDEQMYHK